VRKGQLAKLHATHSFLPYSFKFNGSIANTIAYT
jgi:hypothetical protein